MKVAALAGGIGGGKFLRGLTRGVPGDDLTVIVNVADDVVVHGLHVSPDPDSVTYWLGDAFDRGRGGGRRGATVWGAGARGGPPGRDVSGERGARRVRRRPVVVRPRRSRSRDASVPDGPASGGRPA